MPDVVPLFGDEVLDEEAEVLGRDPIDGEAGYFKEGVEGVDDGETDGVNCMSEERE